MTKDQKHLLHSLYVELVKLQNEIISSGLRLLVILEGRDAAGKDGTVKRITRHLSPRETRVVALPKPSDRETTQWYFQRFARHLPASGEFVIFNRSWYNRAGVENVMGFCTAGQVDDFYDDVELFEKMLLNSGILILKYYLDISRQEQAQRLLDRKKDPLKQWKISPIDEKAQRMWNEYSKARNRMLKETNYSRSPWYVADAENKDAMHIALIAHLLQRLPYQKKDKRLLKKDYGLVFPADPGTLKRRLYP